MERKMIMPHHVIGRRLLLVVGLLLSHNSLRAESPLAESPLAESPLAEMPAQHRELLSAYCFKCHNEKSSEGGVRLDHLPFHIGNIESAERWQKVLDALNAGEMPPADEKQPSHSAKTTFLQDLSTNMVLARKILTDQGGAITMRRLNRREYERTIRELLGVQVDVKSLPSDAGAGFDTAGKSLFFSSDQLEQYLTIARRALDEAIVLGPKPKTMRRENECEDASLPLLKKTLNKWLAEAQNADKAIAADDAETFGYPDIARAHFQKGQASLRIPLHEYLLDHPKSQTGAFLTIFTGYVGDKVEIPPQAAPGQYRLRVRVGAVDDAPSQACFLEFGHRVTGNNDKGGFVTLGYYQVTGTLEDPQTIEIPFTVARQGNREFYLIERGGSDRGIVRFREHLAENGIGILPALWLDSVQWEGPIIESWPPRICKELFFEGYEELDDKAYAHQAIGGFARRAFRGREPDADFLSKLVAWYVQERQSGLSQEQAIKQPLAIVLSSPSFLYMTEMSGEAPGRRRVDSVELASRLSYFLWSAPPDDELIELARNHQLQQPAVLAKQVDRMIDDERFWGFVTGFNHQWLQMERLDFFQFNQMLYPTFDHATKLAARDEVYHTFQSAVRERKGMKHLLHSDSIYINGLLANHYGISGVSGDDFRRVSVDGDSARGGMLSMAAILAMGSDGERSSPVERGAFVLRKILNDPPPPAPANVPQLDRLAGQALPARQLLAAHMEEAQCAQCHRKIDPIGFGLENFNAAGIWREREIVGTAMDAKAARKAKRSGDLMAGYETHPIDPSGQLPDGTGFANFFELRDAVARRTDRFANSFTEAAAEYALGRPIGFADQPMLDKILATAKRSDYQPRVILHAIVASDAFQTK
jgi:hypothetical protein